MDSRTSSDRRLEMQKAEDISDNMQLIMCVFVVIELIILLISTIIQDFAMFKLATFSAFITMLILMVSTWTYIKFS